jgi:hypothetical protein
LELRAVGQTLTAKLNGEVLGTFTDATYSSGSFRVARYASQKADPVLVKRVEILDLDAAPAPAAATAASEPWQDVMQLPADQLILHKGVERTAEGFRCPAEYSKVGINVACRDGAIRVRGALTGGKVGLCVREDGRLGTYMVSVRSDGSMTLRRENRVSGGPARNEDLRLFDLRRPIPPEQECTLELRVVGSTLTVSLDGQVLGSATDTAFTSGGFGVVAVPAPGGPPVVLRQVEILRLDPPGAP